MEINDRLRAGLADLDARDRRRRLAPAAGLDFASNDYLGLAGSDTLREAAIAAIEAGVPLGAGASRLLRGNHPAHEALETRAAAFFGTEAALFMGGGYQANQAIFTALPSGGDLILHDALIHASAHDGFRAARASVRSFAHNDVDAAEDAIGVWRKAGGRGQVWIAVESVYSMDGDLAPLSDFVRLARATDAVLVVDEAHATGVFGDGGRGLSHGLGAELLTVHTCGKALGVSGGLVCGSRPMVDMLINRARSFIFATAPSPLTAVLVTAAIDRLDRDGGLIADAWARIGHAHGAARRAGFAPNTLRSQIVPVIVGDDAGAMALAAALRVRGFDVRGIRPPTVPEGTARLRISITGNVTPGDIDALFAALAEEWRAAA